MKYVALLRGIWPSNPNMRNEKLRFVFEKLGFKNVHTVISSGNIIFDLPAGRQEVLSKNAKALEAKIEKALPKYLGFYSATIIRSHAQLEKLIKSNPFKNKIHGKKSYLVVTFLKKGGEVCDVFNLSKARGGPDMMLQLEKEHGKAITTRTWKTVNRIFAKMNFKDRK